MDTSAARGKLKILALVKVALDSHWHRAYIARDICGGSGREGPAKEDTVSASALIAEQVDTTEPVLDSQRTACCVVGGGPGGMMLALLLARQGVPVTLLEAHKDFDREFRGDTIHPSILEILDQIGLAEPLHKLRHVKVFGP